MTVQARIGDNEWVKGQWKHGFLEFVHTVNRLCADKGIEEVFGEPTRLGDWWVPGMFCEEYPRARIIYTKGTLQERYAAGEGYRIVTDDESLKELWEEAEKICYPKLENRDDPRPKRLSRG